MAHMTMGSSRANWLGQYAASRCPGTMSGRHARVRVTVATCNQTEALSSTTKDSEADGASKELQSWQIHHVHKQLPLRYVALGDDGAYIVGCNEGRIMWSGTVPPYLYKTLNKVLNKEGGSIPFAALGRNSKGKEVWFAKDGKIGYTWLGTDSSKTLEDEFFNKDQSKLDKVFFAPNDGWFALRKDGSSSWRGLPKYLHEALEENWKEWDGVSRLSIGHNGEWFVRYGKGWQYHGVHPVLENLVNNKHNLTGSIIWVELGPDGSFVALFERYTVWYGSQGLTEALLRSESRKAADTVQVVNLPQQWLQTWTARDWLYVAGWMLSFIRLLLDMRRCLRPI